MLSVPTWFGSQTCVWKAIRLLATLGLGHWQFGPPQLPASSMAVNIWLSGGSLSKQLHVFELALLVDGGKVGGGWL